MTYADLKEALNKGSAISWASLKVVYRGANGWQREQIELWTYHRSTKIVGVPHKGDRDKVLRSLRTNR